MDSNTISHDFISNLSRADLLAWLLNEENDKIVLSDESEQYILGILAGCVSVVGDTGVQNTWGPLTKCVSVLRRVWNYVFTC